jgi:ribosomal protein L7/L12
MEAVGKALGIIAEIAEARTKISAAKLVEDEVRVNNPLPALEISTTTQVEEARKAAEAAWVVTEAKARVPFDRATSIYQQQVAEAHAKKNAAIQQAEEKKVATLAAERNAQELRLATAKADIHTANQNVVTIQSSRDRYYQQVKQQLGIDLAALTRTSG